jgi:hypothetical protein
METQKTKQSISKKQKNKLQSIVANNNQDNILQTNSIEQKMANINQDNILQTNSIEQKMTNNILQINTQDNKTTDNKMTDNKMTDNKMTDNKMANNKDNILQPLQRPNDESNLLQTVFLGEKDTKFEEINIANKYFDLTGQYIRPLKVMEEFYIFQFNFDYVEL